MHAPAASLASFSATVVLAFGVTCVSACGATLGTDPQDGGQGGTDGSAFASQADAARGDAADAKVQSWPSTRFASKVISFTPGKCAGYGADAMPNIVLGPPIGYGVLQGSTDVVSLGENGSIVLSVEPNEIVDGPGPDFTIFENAFWVGGNPNKPYADPAEVSISEDGFTWYTYPCTASAPPFGACAGWHPVYSTPTGDISPLDTAKSGGDQYDLAGTGIAKARFIRIVDKSPAPCTDEFDTHGFDLDAIAVIHGTIEP